MQTNASGAAAGPLAGEHTNFAGALLDSMAHGLIVLSSGRRIVGFNDHAERLTGLRAAELLDQPVDSLPPALQAAIDETFVTGRDVARRDVLLAAGTGADTLLQVSTTLARSPGGEVLSVLAELRNVGQARSMAAHLEHLDRLASLGVLGASVAHEIKNALVPIRTFVEMPPEQRADPEMHDLVAQEIRRVDAVVRQMLRGATREEFKLEPLNFHTLLRDALNLLRHVLQARAVKLDAKLAAAADRINGDDRQLRHVVFNLFINAVEAMRENAGESRLTVTTEVVTQWERRHLRVSIADTGGGISAENQARLFSPFFTTKRDGTGLGLAITRRIIHEHNGAITVESRPGAGTTFHIFLPLL
jgi:PAS domain S-box-containing protein